MKRIGIASLVVFISAFNSGASTAGAGANEPAPFSAEMIQKGPQGSMKGKMYVDGGRMRTEMSQNDQQVIHIVDKDKGVRWMLYPAQQAYIEHRGPVAVTSASTKKSSNPCAAMRGAQCKETGREKFSGRDAVKWEITFSAKGKTQAGYQWIDAERGIPLRVEMPNGQKMEMKLLGMEKLAGRSVEKWEMRAWRGDGAPQRTFQWYDPKIKLMIREELPNGVVREMVNIREGRQPDNLFTIPAGFKKMAPPAGQGRRR